MEKTFVVRQVSKIVENSGTETVIDTQENIIKYDLLLQKNVVIPKDKISIDEATFIAKVENTDIYTFIYDGENWLIGGNSVDLEEYGIAVNGIMANGDIIKVVYFKDDDDNDIVLYAYAVRVVSLQDKFDYVDVYTNDMTTILINADAEDDVSNIFGDQAKRFTAEFPSQNLDIRVENRKDYDVVVNCIVAKKVE